MDCVKNSTVHTNAINNKTGRNIEISIYTDPLCCWSWAFQPQLDLIVNTLGDCAQWHYKMGGLIPSWNNFHDDVNNVSRPAQMGPVWMHAGQVCDRPIHHQVWIHDAPASSYPSCIAVKCAQLQDPDYGTTYLGLLRTACMGQGKNIAKPAILFDLAADLKTVHPGFDFNRFKTDYTNDAGLEAFRTDIDEVRKFRITRFPTLIVRSENARAIMISGYRHADEVLKAINDMSPTEHSTPAEQVRR